MQNFFEKLRKRFRDIKDDLISLCTSSKEFKINDSGINNTIIFKEGVDIDSLSSFSIKGDNNQIIIGKGSHLINAHFIMESNNNTILIGEHCRITGRCIQKIVDGNRIEVGNNTTFGNVYIICGEGRKVKIGEDCMLSFDVSLRTSDSHAIIDSISKKRVNFGGDIIIGDHVWIAAHVVVLKGVIISDNSVVALKALVVNKFTSAGIIIGGVPAKVMKEGINWERPLLG